MQPEKKNMRNIILMIVGLITGFIIGYLIVNHVLTSPTDFDKQLMNMANEINKLCPVMIDSETILDNVMSIPRNQLVYNYTLVNSLKANIDIDQLNEQRRSLLINSIKTRDDKKIFRKNNVTLSCNFKDKEGVFLFKIVIGPKDYTE